MKYTIIFLLGIFSISLTTAENIKSHYFDISYGERKLPVKVYVPAEFKETCPLIIYSHGLGGSRETKSYLMEHWANAGFICVAVQHPGSDESVWKDAPRFKRLKAMKEAASAEQFINRSNDIPAVLNQLERWHDTKDHLLYQKIDFTKIAMSGHSFGAVTSQAMMGTNYIGGKNYHEKRFKAFLLMSPSPVPVMKDQTRAFGHITSPVLCMTGTKDSSIIKPGTGYEERMQVYKALPDGNKYVYVFDEGKHNLFSGPTKLSKQLTDDHKQVQTISLLFFQAYLLDNKESLQTLKNLKANDKDSWTFK